MSHTEGEMRAVNSRDSAHLKDTYYVWWTWIFGIKQCSHHSVKWNGNHISQLELMSEFREIIMSTKNDRMWQTSFHPFHHYKYVCQQIPFQFPWSTNKTLATKYSCMFVLIWLFIPWLMWNVEKVPSLSVYVCVRVYIRQNFYFHMLKTQCLGLVEIATQQPMDGTHLYLWRQQISHAHHHPKTISTNKLAQIYVTFFPISFKQVKWSENKKLLASGELICRQRFPTRMQYTTRRIHKFPSEFCIIIIKRWGRREFTINPCHL